MAEIRVVEKVLVPVLTGRSLPHVVARVGDALELPLANVLVPLDVAFNHFLQASKEDRNFFLKKSCKFRETSARLKLSADKAINNLFSLLFRHLVVRWNE